MQVTMEYIITQKGGTVNHLFYKSTAMSKLVGINLQKVNRILKNSLKMPGSRGGTTANKGT